MSEISVKKTEKKQKNGRHKISAPGPGRPKGSKNKFTNLKESFLEAYKKLGGTEGLVEWAEKNSYNRKAFYQMIASMLPKNVDITATGNITVEISEKFMPKKGNGEK